MYHTILFQHGTIGIGTDAAVGGELVSFMFGIGFCGHLLRHSVFGQCFLGKVCGGKHFTVYRPVTDNGDGHA
ncbi:hypothetical protein D3C80_2046670 [compost metagenome]